MNKIQTKRLEKLATHLESGKLGHDKFDFGKINYGGKEPNDCGTLGCALGELPLVFPRFWRFNFDSICYVSQIHYNIKDVQYWFGIDNGEAEHLFFPGIQQPEKYRGVILSHNATREEVASNIRAFLKIKAKK